jgi:carboxylesterase
MLHGLGGGPYEFAPVTEALRAAGLEVMAPVLPGHEGTGRVMPASTWREWREAAGRELAALSDRAGPTAVAGFSTGGTISLALAAEEPERVARLVLVCPFLAVRHYRFLGPRPETLLNAGWGRWIGQIPRRWPATKSREARRAVGRATTHRFRTFSLHATRSALELIERVRGMVDRVEAPTLIVQSRRDSTVQPTEAAWLFDRIGAREKELVWLERSDHLAAWDHDRDELIARVAGFLGVDPAGRSG